MFALQTSFVEVLRELAIGLLRDRCHGFSLSLFFKFRQKHANHLRKALCRDARLCWYSRGLRSPPCRFIPCLFRSLPPLLCCITSAHRSASPSESGEDQNQNQEGFALSSSPTLAGSRVLGDETTPNTQQEALGVRSGPQSLNRNPIGWSSMGPPRFSD
ncbi:hypothetical protein D3C75_843130 [compost metagenome]